MVKKAKGVAISTIFHFVSLVGILVGGALLLSDYRYEQHIGAAGVEVEATILDRATLETDTEVVRQLIVAVPPVVPGGTRRIVPVDREEWLRADGGNLLWVTVDPDPPHDVHRGKRAELSFFRGSEGWLFLVFFPVFCSMLMPGILWFAERWIRRNT